MACNVSYISTYSPPELPVITDGGISKLKVTDDTSIQLLYKVLTNLEKIEYHQMLATDADLTTL